MTKNTLEPTIWIAAPRQRVWQAVTEPAQLAQWFLPPMLGAQMKRDDKNKLHVCMGDMEIPVALLEVFDTHRVVIRSLPDRLLTATYTLKEEDNGTRVIITLDGFEALPEEARQERLAPSRIGWGKALENLKAYIDEMALPFPEGLIAALFGYRRETKEKFAVERSIWIDASRERVWRAITEPEQIQQWYSPGTPWRLSTLEVGGRLAVYDPDTGTDTFVEIIKKVDPPYQLVLHSDPAPPDTLRVTTYTLAEENGGTRLTITEAGYELETNDTRHNNMEQNAFGFGMMLENLQAYIAGASLPYPRGF